MGGDCCAKTVENNGVKTGVVKTKFCKECKCLDPDNQGDAPDGCDISTDKFKGDGNCDDGNNNEGCEYDGGDCCAASVAKDGVKTGVVVTEFCTECKCLDPSFCPGECAIPGYQGDGNCDDNNNNCGCDYDGGDCCAKTVENNGVKTGVVKTNFCKECKCLDPDNQGDAPAGCVFLKFKGDGNCDDDNNN